MIIRLFALIILLGMSYILCIFLTPGFADTYGNREFNAKVRAYKEITTTSISGSENPLSLIEKLTHTSQAYIDETKQNYTELEQTVSGKVQQVQQTIDSVNRAYEAVNEARDNIHGLVGGSGVSGEIKQ